jgi:hypothetical protein
MLVLRSELPTERRFLVPVHERPDDGAKHQRVPHQEPSAEHCCLSENHRSDGEIHRVSDVAIETADDEPLRRRSRRGRSDPLSHEAGESLEKHSCARSQRDPADDPQPRGCAGRLPSGQKPRADAGDHPGREQEKQEAPNRCLKAPHSRIVRASTCPRAERALRDSRAVVRPPDHVHAQARVVTKGQTARSHPSSPCDHGTALPRSKISSSDSLPGQTAILSLSG